MQFWGEFKSEYLLSGRHGADESDYKWSRNSQGYVDFSIAQSRLCYKSAEICSGVLTKDKVSRVGNRLIEWHYHMKNWKNWYLNAKSLFQISEQHYRKQPHSSTKYLRLTLVFMWNSTLRKSLIFIFQEFLLVLTKFSFRHKDWALGYHSVKFRHFPDIS